MLYPEINQSILFSNNRGKLRMDLFQEVRSSICHLLCSFDLLGVTGNLKSYIPTTYRGRNSEPMQSSSRSLMFSLFAWYFSLPVLHCVSVRIPQFSVAMQSLSVGIADDSVSCFSNLINLLLFHQKNRRVHQKILWLQSLHIYAAYGSGSIESRISLLICRKSVRNLSHRFTSISVGWSHLWSFVLSPDLSPLLSC